MLARKPGKLPSTGTCLLVACLCGSLLRGAAGAPGDVLASPDPVLSEVPRAERAIERGDLSVASQSGGLAFSYPIPVAPGRGGAEPRISLSYASQGAIYGGIASHWTLGGVPSVSLDPVQARPPACTTVDPAERRFVSSLAGGRELVPVSEPSVASDVAQAYRAQNDGGFIRFERMKITQAPYRWRARTTDGTTWYFGEGERMGHGSQAGPLDFAPLTRTVDAFGNEVRYTYNNVRDPTIPADVDYSLELIEYSINTGAGLGVHAEVRFHWARDLCPGSDIPPGARLDYRSGVRRVWGSERLERIETWAAEPYSTSLRKVRTIELDYDQAALSCTASHAPLRLLTSITETGYDLNGAATDLSPITFTYAPPARTFSDSNPARFDLGTIEIQNSPATAPLTWGYRDPLGGEWPTVQAMTIDFDGDGKLDRLFVPDPGPAPPGPCVLRWQKNLGDGFGSSVGNEVVLPSLPWDPTASGQHCSLTGQYTLFENRNPPVQTDSKGTYLAYRFVDMNGNGLPDLVAAVHHDPHHYDPSCTASGTPMPWCNQDAGLPFSLPSCNPTPQGCPDVDPACLEGAVLCGDPWEPSEPCCLRQAEVDHCFSTVPLAPCEQLMGPPPPQDPSEAPRPAHEACGGEYPWAIYWNTGGALDPNPHVFYSPIPLDSEQGESSLGSTGISGFFSTEHAIVDLDGDGIPDIATRKHVDTGSGANVWFFFRGEYDPAGNTFEFVGKPDGKPYAWMVPTGAKMSAGHWSSSGTQVTTWTHTGLADVNGDGLVDLVYADQFGNPLGFYPNLGNQFWVGPDDLPSNVLTAHTTALSDTLILRDQAQHPNAGTSSMRQRPVDYDLDGRIDLLAAWENRVHISNGETLASPRFVASAPPPVAYVKLVEADTSPAWWELRRDLIDLDGDGRSDLLDWSGLTPEVHYDPDDGKPQRLMIGMDNGRGGKAAIRYTHVGDRSAGSSVSGNGIPSHVWVVESIARNNGDGLAPTAAGTTRYEYADPVWNADDFGRHGFRGFMDTAILPPGGSKEVTYFEYEPDWSGREVGRTVWESAGSASSTQTITRTSWGEEPLTLFSGDVYSHFPEFTKTYVCQQQTEEACEQSSTYRYEETAWEPLSVASTDVLYVPAVRSLSDSDDLESEYHRQRRTSFDLLYEDDAYRLRVVEESLYEVEGTSEALAGKQVFEYDPSLRVVLSTEVFVEDSAQTARKDCNHFDLDTGNLLWRAKPQQVADAGQACASYGGPRATFTYDDHAIHMAAVENELSHRVETDYDPGTGALLEQRGPNEKTGAIGGLEKTRTRYDGLARPVEIEATFDVGQQNYALHTIAELDYHDDSAVACGGGPSGTCVVTRSLIEIGQSDWVTTRQAFDGWDRIVKDTTESQTSQPDAVTTYHWDDDGTLEKIDIPDPRTDDGSTVEYTFDYDGLGRLEALVRPDLTVVVTSYEGLSRVVSEVASDAGPASKTVLTEDVFGRLVEVEEDPLGVSAATSYEFDASDNVARIINADGIVTELEHDFAGNRTAVTRAGRTWVYGYDGNDNLVAIRSPHPVGQEAAYTTSILYDDLDRVEERLPATRDLTTQQLEELAIGPTEYVYDDDDGWNPIGRLARVELPFATVKYRYDAQGNVIREDRTVALISGAATGTCGDFVCEPELGESCITCNQDCGLCAVGCGDGTCQPERGESCTTCPQDCGNCPFCGDGACQPDLGENASTCPADCAQTASEFVQIGWCGDGACRGTETPANCPRDCPGGTGFCGDAICQNWEWPQTCCRDCGSGFARQGQCGNGSCEVYIGTCPNRPSCGTCVGASQNSFNCPADCGPVHTCGDGICQWEEDCSSCPQDCGACACGNSVCEPGAGESCETCPQDCGACPAGSESRAIVRSYNALGGLTAVWHADDATDPSHTTFEYDLRGLPVAALLETGSGPQTLARVYRNVSGRITLRTLNQTPILDGAQGATWIYDSLGRVEIQEVSVPDGQGRTVVARQELAYFDTGDVKTLVNALDGTTSTFTFTFDDRHQLKSAQNATLGYSATFQYTPAGRLAAASVNAPSASPLAIEREVDYIYSAAASDPEAVDVLENKVGGGNLAEMTYDEAGNLLSRFEQSGSTTYSFVYDGDNRKREAQVTGAATREVYFYDHAGQRMLTIEKDASTGAVQKTRFWFGETEVWYDGADNVDRAWAHIGLGQPVARIERRPSQPDTVTHSYHSSLQHHLVALDQNDDLVAGFVYGPFGEILDQTGSAEDFLRRFNDKEHDELPRLYYYGFRNYDPLLLTWTQADPLYRFIPDLALHDPRRMNLYAFSLQSPLRYVDPDGLDATSKDTGTTAGRWEFDWPASMNCFGADNYGACSLGTAAESFDLTWGFHQFERSLKKKKATIFAQRAVIQGGRECEAEYGGAHCPGRPGENGPPPPRCEKNCNALALTAIAIPFLGPLVIHAVVAAPSAALGAAVRGGGKTTTVLYRAMSQAELGQLMATGRFAAGPGALGGKWFAENQAHATQWGRWFFRGDNFRIVAVELPKAVADAFMRIGRLDGIGPARYAELEQLTEFVLRIVK